MNKKILLTVTLALYSGASYGNSCGALSGPSGFQSSSFGGVSFSKSAEVMLQATDIEGAAYDEATGQIIFYGKRNTSVTLCSPLIVELSDNQL